MGTLYQIRAEIDGFTYECDPETGELLNALEWDALNMAFEEKVENTACYIKNLKSDVEALRNEEKALAKRRQSAEKTIAYLEQLLADNMGGQKFSTAKCVVSFRPSESVEVVDLAHIPAEFLRVKTSYEPDKVAIKAKIKSGQEVSGCQLVSKLNTQIK